MDKGLDIAALRATLAWHAGLARHGRQLAVASRRISRLITAPSGLSHLAEALASAATDCSARPRWDIADRTLQWHEDPDRRVLCCCDADYPPRLRHIPTPPLLLFVDGDPASLNRPQFAIVGSRKATRGACDFARHMAAQLASRGAAITSGLALGIDAAAHRGALAEQGITLAVLGCGIDRMYPSVHRKLGDEIRQSGALVSEFPLGAAPRPAHFPQRNRLIAGLSVGTLVVEAASRSGSISTAMHALEQGREVFAVPGSVNNPLSRGCHVLIKQGAKLTESVEDVLEELPFLGGSMPERYKPRPANIQPALALDRASAALLETFGWAPCSVDEVVRRSGLTVQEVSSMLLPLELSGALESRGNGTYVRVR